MSSNYVTDSVTYPAHASDWRRFRPHSPWQWIATWWPSLICLAIIRAESTDHFSASNTKHRYFAWFNQHVWVVSWDRWGLINWELRKGGHLLGYGIICMVFYFCCTRTLLPHIGESVWRLRRRCATGALALTLLLAGADEFHQIFIPSRTASFHDVFTDVAGGFLMLLLWFGLQAFFRPDAQ
jgi:hypothetical protein